MDVDVAADVDVDVEFGCGCKWRCGEARGMTMLNAVSNLVYVLGYCTAKKMNN